ncbi:MAG: glycosyltransferase WbuB [Alphaproteobacteria bacterium]|nr:MAG: glycosyltransferase WbuB [Alphaproteobacteria bacterium]
MKILYHHRTASKDGQAVHIEELIAAFRRLGHEVVVVGPRWSERQSFGSESRLVGLLRRYLPRAAFEALEFAYTLVAYRNLRRAYRAHRPDVFYERYNLFLLAGAWLRRRTGIPYILEVNAPLFDERQRFGGLRLRRLAAWCQKTAWQSADAVLPVTGVLAGYVRRDGVPESRITVIQNGINRAAFLGPVDGSEVRRRYGLEGRLVLGFTGFMREWHGLGSVVELLAQADPALDLHLLVVGDGPGRQDLTDQAARLGVAERIHVAGLVDRDAIPAHVAAFDIALQPAATAYASPLKIFEYMALGRAIVAPRQANIEEILCDGETALLFAPGDGADFRAQVERLCTDVDLRRRLGAAARRTIEDNDMTWDGNARRVEALFRDMLRARADRTQVRRN